MTPVFPPVSSRHAELDRLAAFFDTISAGREAVYLSAPLTTGPRLVSWRRSLRSQAVDPAIRDEDEFRSAVLSPNQAAAAEFARTLRLRLGRPVIDPTSLPDQPEWTQIDYRVFWGKVIERVVSRVVFMDGWAVSDGCTYEFYVACRSGCDTLHATLEPLTLHAGMAEIAEGIRERIAHAQDAAFAEQVLEAVSGLTPATSSH